MIKKQLCRLLACTLLVTLLTGALPAAAAARFSDVPAGHWAAASIQRAVDLGIFQGKSKHTFGVGQKITRAAFVVALDRFFGWEDPAPGRGTYTDVQDPNAWYYGAVEAAYAHKAITRQEDTFRPADPITREEIAVMLVRTLGLGTVAGLAQTLDTPFRDLTTNIGYISIAHELGLFSGTTASTFSPERTATREQAAVILVRLYDRLHRSAPGRIGLLPAGAEVRDLAGASAAAVSGTRLAFSGKVLLTSQPEPEVSARMQADIRAAGAKPLLYVSGTGNIFRARAAETAGTLAAAVQEGGWDGLFLDVSKLKYENRKDLTELVRALNTALGSHSLYVMAEAPSWNSTSYEGYDYAALGAAADRLVLRIASYNKKSDFPTTPPQPLEELYYALAEMKGTVPPQKLSVLLSTTGAVSVNGRRSGEASAADIDALLADPDTGTYYIERYACACLTSDAGGRETVIWYLNQTAMADRVRLLSFFGLDQVCLSDLGSLSPSVLTGLGVR